MRELTAQSFLSVVESANSFSLEQERQVLVNPGTSVGLPLYIKGTLVGLIPPVSVPHLAKFPDVFVYSATAVHVHDSFGTLDARSEAVAKVLAELRAQAVFPCLKGWRNEEYPIFGRPGQGILLRVERSAVGVLGVRAAGCHLNAYLRDADGHLKMWISRRSFTKQTYPGMLDNTAGGGLPYGVDPFDNMVKEAQEEAGIPCEIASKCKPCGTVTFYVSCDRGWIPDLEFNYDIELPADFIPKPMDGEVVDFQLMDEETVMKNLMEGQFTPEAGSVMLDFLIRHGIVNASNEPNYLEITDRLHRTLPFPSPSYFKGSNN